MQESQLPTSHTLKSPHTPLPRYYGTEAQRQHWLREIFTTTAQDYDRLDQILSLGIGPWYRRQALLRAGLKPGMTALDVGMGTGLVTRAAIRIIGDPAAVTGIDPSIGMLTVAELPSKTRLVQGMAENLPFAAAQYDFLSMGYALRHVADLRLAFTEYYRVLKPGGRLCLLEITRPAGPLATWLLKGYMTTLVPLILRWTGRQADTVRLLRYYWETIATCLPPEQILAELRAVGFAQVLRYTERGIFSEYRAIKPER